MNNDARAKMVCVLGASGGVGASTIAANLAVSLQRAPGARSVAIMETTLTGGDLPLMLGVATDAGLRSLPTDPRSIDEALLMGAQTTHRSGLNLLRLGRSSPLRPIAGSAVLARTLELMVRWYDWIVVDCGCATEHVMHAVIPRTGTVLLVATPALPSAQRAKQWAELLIDTGVPSAKIAVVLNRCREDDAEYRRQLASILPCRIGMCLPDAPDLARDALIAGTPVAAVDSRAALTRGLEELAAVLSGQPAGSADRKSRGLFRRVQARFRRTGRAA